MLSEPSSEVILLALHTLVPVVFSRATAEYFEIPQSALLSTGALLLLWGGLAGELLGFISRAGLGGWFRALAPRLAGAALVGFVVQDFAGFTVVALGSLAAALAGVAGCGARGSRAGGPGGSGSIT